MEMEERKKWTQKEGKKIGEIKGKETSKAWEEVREEATQYEEGDK
jgi:hypothetical protein